MFYGSGRGCSYDYLGACRDPDHVPSTLRLVPIPSQSIILLAELEDLPQIDVEDRKLIAKTMQTTLAIS